MVADRGGVGAERLCDVPVGGLELIGRLVLFGYTWALIHHMLGGIRHLIWDTAHGFGAGASASGWHAPTWSARSC